MTALCVSLAGVLLLTGCQQAPKSVDTGPQLDDAGQRRSVVLDTPLLSHLKDYRNVEDGYQWYDGRNDLSPAALAGYEWPVVQRSVTITRDRQYQSHGRVHDHFSSTTYRSEYRGSVR